MTRRPRVNAALAVGTAIVAALAVVPVKLALNAAVGRDVGFLPAVAVVVVAAWLGGYIPGLVATVVSILLEASYFMSPVGQLDLALPGELDRLALFGLLGILISWLTWLRSQTEERAHRAREEAEQARERMDVIVRRLGALQGLGARLAGALTRDEITDALLAHGMAALQADGAAVFLVIAGGDELEAIGWSGYEASRASRLARLPLDLPTPATDVARTGEPVYLEDPAAYVARYGASLAAVGVAVEPRAVAAVPLDVEGKRYGVLGFTWNEHHVIPDDRRTFIASLASLGAGALERARLSDLERDRVAELEGVIGAIGEGILVSEADGSVRSMNDAAIRLLGGRIASVGALLGCLRAAAGEAPHELPEHHTEFQLRDRPGAWVEVVSYPVGGSPGVAGSTVVVCRDVTAFRHGQGLREAFLSLLSHELRTPVTTIYGGSSVLTRPGSAISDETKAEILVDIAEEANRLYRLVEDLLVLARFDEDVELGAEPSLLQRVVPPVLEQERAHWPTVRFALHVAPGLPAVSADPTSVQQVVRNLLSNAAKYSGLDAVVDVHIEAAPDGVAVRIRDHGVGIDPEEAENLFDPFYRSPHTARLASGAGIGLYVSRRLVEAMGGRIWASPADRGGSEFTFVLPRYLGDPGD